MSSSTVDQARTAWVTASRDEAYQKWAELYDLAVPQTAHTTWERHEAGYAPRDRDEQARYRELDAAQHQASGIEAGQ